MNRLRMSGVVALAIAAAACGGLDVTTDWDPAFDFRTPQTFTVLNTARGEPLDRLDDERVKSAIAATMTAKGLRQVADTSEADIAVGYQFTSEEHSSYQTVNTGWNSYGYGGYGGWYRPGYGAPMMTASSSRTTEQRYDVGSLLIAVFDTEAREMVYTSTGSKTLDDTRRSPEEMQQRIDAAVADILRDYPPGG